MPTLLSSFDQRRGFATARRYWAPLASAQGTCGRFLLAAGPDQTSAATITRKSSRPTTAAADGPIPAANTGYGRSPAARHGRLGADVADRAVYLASEPLGAVRPFARSQVPAGAVKLYGFKGDLRRARPDGPGREQRGQAQAIEGMSGQGDPP